MPNTAIDTDQFNRIARRNVTLPLVVGLVSAAAFLAFFIYFMTVTGWVDHTHQVIGKLNELTTLQADMESGARGYVVTGDESFLAPYQVAKPQLSAQLEDLIQQTADNPVQTDRLKRVRALQTGWEAYAQQIIDLRRQGGDAAAVVKSLSGKQLSDRVRAEVLAARSNEQTLLKERLDSLQSVTWLGIGAYVLFIILVNCWIAWAGRRDIKQLSHDFGGALKAQTDAANVLAAQAWVRDGQAQLAETLIGQQTLTTVGRSVLSFAGRYLDPIVAAMYVRDERGQLQRVSTHGFDGSVDHGQVAAARAGLVGQAARDGRLQPRHQPEGQLFQGRLRPRRDRAGRTDRRSDQQRRRHQRRHRAGLHAHGRRARPGAAEADRRQHRRVGRLGAVPQAPAGFGRGDPAAQRGAAGAAGGAAHRQRGTGRTVARAHRIADRTWSTSRPSSRPPTRSWPSRRACSIARTRLSTRRRSRCRIAPTNCSARAATSPSSSPTCRTSCARRSTAR